MQGKSQFVPDKGYCAAQGSHYYGYKLHAVCSVDGIFQSIDLSPASVHDINYLKDIKMQISDCTLIGDRGYLSADIQLNLFETCNIKLDTPMRSDQKEYKQQAWIFRKKRKKDRNTILPVVRPVYDKAQLRKNLSKIHN